VATACAVTSAGVSQTPTTSTVSTTSTLSTRSTLSTTSTVSTTSTLSTTNKGGGTGGKRIAPRLPADFPAAVRLYPGVLQGSTGRSPRWAVLIFVRAGAAHVQKSAIAFYVARGYHADSGAVVHNARFRLTMIAATRDHSATQTNLMIGVTTR
jgi:hypothetical protein